MIQEKGGKEMNVRNRYGKGRNKWVCVSFFRGCWLILLWLKPYNDIKCSATFSALTILCFGVVVYLCPSLILVLVLQSCSCNYKGKNQAASPGFKHSRVNASSQLRSWYGTSSCHANCRATLHSRVHQLSQNWDYALSWKLWFIVSNYLCKIMFIAG